MFYLKSLLAKLDTCTVKPVLNGHSQKDFKLVFNTNYRLLLVKSIAECSKGSIMQYFRPSLSNHVSLRSLFCLILSGLFTQVLLYMQNLNFIANSVAEQAGLSLACQLTSIKHDGFL